MVDQVHANGSRTRIGIICPDDGINDDEYWNYLPEGVTLLWTRYRTPTRFDPISISMISSYGDLSVIREAAETLTSTRPDVVAFCCNSCSFVHGAEVDAKIRDVISKVTSSRATSITEAQIKALRTLKAKRVAIGAPYPMEVTQKLKELLEACDFEITGVKSLGLTSEWEIGNSPESRWYDLATEVNNAQADCVLLACGGIRTSGVIADLENDLGKPVVSAPAVMIWDALRLADVPTKVPQRGILLEQH